MLLYRLLNFPYPIKVQLGFPAQCYSPGNNGKCK